MITGINEAWGAYFEYLYGKHKEKRREIWNFYKRFWRDLIKAASNCRQRCCVQRLLMTITNYKLERSIISILRGLGTLDDYKRIRAHPMAWMSALPFYPFSNFPGPCPLNDIRNPRFPDGRRLCVFDDELRKKLGRDMHIALVPQATQEGGIICQLQGDERTFVLRQIPGETSSCNEKTNNFWVVGVCFICRWYFEKERFESSKYHRCQNFVLQ